MLMKCSLKKPQIQLLGPGTSFPFLNSFVLPHIRVERGVGLRIHSISLMLSPPQIFIWFVINSTWPVGQFIVIQNLPHARQNKVKQIVLKEEVIVDNIITSHHLHSFLSQVMKQLWNLDGLNLPSALQINFQWFR